MLRGLATAFCIVPLWLSPGATAQPAPGEGVPAASQGEGRPLIADDTIKRLLMEGPRGSLAITVTQGTKAGPPISDLELRVDLYHRNDPIY